VHLGVLFFQLVPFALHAVLFSTLGTR
jgi:hypothetical protein